ncbi:MAG: VacB/RNase II family 3'-5' exoribonuclease [bacterium]
MSRKIKAHRISGYFKRKASGAGSIYDSKSQTDIQIPGSRNLYLVDKDLIEISIPINKSNWKNRLSIALLKRRSDPVIGYFKVTGRDARVFPLDSRISPPISIVGKYPMQAIGKVVAVQLMPEKRFHTEPKGTIVRIIGHRLASGVQTVIITEKFNIRDHMPEEVIRNAEKLIDQAKNKTLEKRVDLRSIPTITVDPPDAKDFDDALSIQDIPSGYRLGVHIADVSHYIPPDSLVDKEAFLRGTSVYLPERAIHMLPAPFATEISSLIPPQDRLTVTVMIDVDTSGHMIEGKIFESIIRSDARLTYTDFLEAGKNPDTDRMPSGLLLSEICNKLKHLCHLLLQQRINRGVLDLDMPETHFEFDSEGNIIGIHKKMRSQAEQTIEEFMIAANIIVARFLDNAKIPYLKRLHEAPNISEIADLKQSLAQLDLIPPHNPLNPPEVREFLNKIDNAAIRSVASYRILRSMKRAVYSAGKSGHFGLALDSYTQFTSPIRRYPDLEVHRSVKTALGIPGYFVDKKNILERKALSLSESERRAQEAEWEAQKIEKIRFMQSKIGSEFSGTITHIVPFGAYIEVEEPFVEGFLPVSRIDTNMLYNENRNSLSSHDNSLLLKPGYQIRVRLEIADIDRAMLDFSLIDSV